MALYKQKGSNVWWYEFQIGGVRHRQSARTTSKKVAGEAMKARRRQIEESANGITKREMPKLFADAANEHLLARKGNVTDGTLEIMQRQIWHLLPFFGKKLLIEITAADVKKFIESKVAAGITPRGVNMKLIVLRSILRRNHLWERIRPDLSMLRVGETPGKALTLPEENKLLGECLASNSRTIHLAVVLALCTGMRRDEIRLLQWKQIYLKDGYLTVGHSKTVNGTGRIVPLNNRAFKTLSAWADTFPKRSPEHYVFPIEKYAGSPIGNAPTIYGHDPTKPLKSWKAAWDRARIRSGVWIRFHDLRHTAITRMLEARVTLLEVAKIVGWSPSTMTLMAARYAHLNREVLRNAVAALEGPSKPKASKPGKDSPKRIGVKRQEIEKPAQRKRA